MKGGFGLLSPSLPVPRHPPMQCLRTLWSSEPVPHVKKGGECAHCHRTLQLLCCLHRSSQERQFASRSVLLLTSVVALGQPDGCRDSFVSKVRARLEEVC